MRLEHENDYAKKGVAGTALGLSIGAVAAELLGGTIGNLFTGGTMSRACGHEDHTVNRYEAAQAARIAELETEVKLRDANTYTDQKLLEMYKYFDGKIGCVESAINAQAVYNATNTATINCISNQVAQLMALTKVVIPTTSICPEPMARYNSWVAPTAPATT